MNSKEIIADIVEQAHRYDGFHLDYIPMMLDQLEDLYEANGCSILAEFKEAVSELNQTEVTHFECPYYRLTKSIFKDWVKARLYEANTELLCSSEDYSEFVDSVVPIDFDENFEDIPF